jgi:hypothetical protein
MAAAADAFEEQVAAATTRGDHMWIMSGAWKLTAAAVRGVLDGDPDAVHLDLENLVHLQPGCYICEEPLTARLFHRSCRGEPT